MLTCLIVRSFIPACVRLTNPNQILLAHVFFHCVLQQLTAEIQQAYGGSSGPKRPLEEQVQHLFNLIDEDGGGTIDEEEMARAYGEDSVLLMHRMELDENGEVGLEAWQRFWLQEMAQENAAMRDHLMATLELNVAETQVKDRKKRRMFYRTAKQRRQEGYSARYSSRPLAAAEAKDGDGVSMKAQARAATQALLKSPRPSSSSMSPRHCVSQRGMMGGAVMVGGP